MKARTETSGSAGGGGWGVGVGEVIEVKLFPWTWVRSELSRTCSTAERWIVAPPAAAADGLVTAARATFAAGLEALGLFTVRLMAVATCSATTGL
jgi:hypothetical protein